jgi:hypothetical protein
VKASHAPHAPDWRGRRIKLGEALQDGADRAGDSLIGIKQGLTILFSLNQADRQSAAQFAASGLVANPAGEPRTNDMQLVVVPRETREFQPEHDAYMRGEPLRW